jgi:hypothetical protein
MISTVASGIKKIYNGITAIHDDDNNYCKAVTNEERKTENNLELIIQRRM